MNLEVPTTKVSMSVEGRRQTKKGARIMIEKALKDDTVLDLQQIRYSGELWKELQDNYLKKTETDICKLDNVVGWQKDSRQTLGEGITRCV